jgi:hypothetical protein
MRRLVILGIMGIIAAVSTGCERPLPRKPGQPIVPDNYTVTHPLSAQRNYEPFGRRLESRAFAPQLTKPKA